MIFVRVDYATPSVFESERDRTTVGLSANARRPVRFHGRVVKHTFLLRVALRALGQAVWSNDTWLSAGDFMSSLLDPVITVHPDRLFFEAFSQDQSVYAMVTIDPALFETEGEVRTGTTNVDFTAWLWGALSELRTRRETWLRVDPGGFEVKTKGAGGRFEQKVELPNEWVCGFLQLQGAMAMPGTRVTARSVDLLAAIRYLKYTKAKLSPRALRYEFEPGQEACIVLEPWEHVVRLKGAQHNYTEPRKIRTWGRRRLRLIEPLLPFAECVDIYLKGRALPSFYAVKLPGITFVLGLSGWTGQTWTETRNFDLLSGDGSDADPARLAQAHEALRSHRVASVKQMAQALEQPLATAARWLEELCRRGQAIYDVEARAFRHRELFEQPVDVTKLYPPDPRPAYAREFLSQKAVTIRSCTPRETRKIKELATPNGKVTREVVYRDWQVLGKVHAWDPVEIVVNDLGRIIFGTCACEFFKENLLNKGPCEHMLALLRASDTLRQDLPTSIEAPEQTRPTATTRARSGRVEPDDEDENETNSPNETLDEDERKEDNHAS